MLGWRTLRALPRLCDYHEAAKHEARVKPIRGDAHNTKPLGRRNQKWRFIQRLDNGDIIIAHGCPESTQSRTELIRYKPDGTIHLTVHHPSATDNEVINYVLGWRVATHDKRTWVKTTEGWLPLRKQPRKYVSGKGWVYGPEVDNSFTPGEAKETPQSPYARPTPTMRNPNYPTVHRVNRAGARRARAKYQPFRDYYAAMRKLRGERIDQMALREEIKAAFGVDKDGYNHGLKVPGFYSWKPSEHVPPLHALMMSDEPEDQYKALLWFEYGRLYATKPEKLFNAVAFYMNYSTCLTKEIITTGKLVRDNYSWAEPAAKPS